MFAISVTIGDNMPLPSQLQLTETGPSGRPGHRAVQRVGVETNHRPALVTIHHPVGEEIIAMATQPKPSPAIHRLAYVRIFL